MRASEDCQGRCADVRHRVVELRKQSWSLLELAAEFSVSKSSVHLWTKDHPLDPDDERVKESRRRHAQSRSDARWGAHREAHDAERAQVNTNAAAWVGELSEPEVLLVGSVAY
jgi:hypothetical protein